MASEDWAQMRAYLAKHNQEHLLRWLDQLTEKEKKQLYSDLRDLELEKVNRLGRVCVLLMKCKRVKYCFLFMQRYYIEAQQMFADNSEKKDTRLQPLDEQICGSTARDSDSVGRWWERGLDKVGRGEVGVLLLAGKPSSASRTKRIQV